MAAARGHVDCVQALLDANSPIDAVEQDGKTALIIALENGNVDIASILITNGCDINHADHVSLVEKISKNDRLRYQRRIRCNSIKYTFKQNKCPHSSTATQLFT